MKLKHSPEIAGSSQYDRKIDAALRLYGGALPESGLESRIAARMARANGPSFRPAGSARMLILRRFSTAALAAAAACAIVTGTVRHSHRLNLPQSPRALESDGVSGSHAAHVPTRAAQQAPSLDPRSPRTPARHRAAIVTNQGAANRGAANRGAAKNAANPQPPDEPRK